MAKAGRRFAWQTVQLQLSNQGSIPLGVTGTGDTLNIGQSEPRVDQKRIRVWPRMIAETGLI
jgi:hypothetical protein